MIMKRSHSCRIKKMCRLKKWKIVKSPKRKNVTLKNSNKNCIHKKNKTLLKLLLLQRSKFKRKKIRPRKKIKKKLNKMFSVKVRMMT